jgi:hypothetical protein
VFVISPAYNVNGQKYVFGEFSTGLGTLHDGRMQLVHATSPLLPSVTFCDSHLWEHTNPLLRCTVPSTADTVNASLYPPPDGTTAAGAGRRQAEFQLTLFVCITIFILAAGLAVFAVFAGRTSSANRTPQVAFLEFCGLADLLAASGGSSTYSSRSSAGFPILAEKGWGFCLVRETLRPLLVDLVRK